jgi:lysophospholipase L1-like esterase
VIIDPLLLEPFWLSKTMRSESLFFVDRGDGAAMASLLFDRVERLMLATATGEVEFEPGRDYTVDTASGVVRRTAASRIPFATLAELYPPHDPFVLVADDDEFHRRQTIATYLHEPGGWHGYVPRLATVELRRTLQRLAASRPLTVCITGDSISEGYNASGFTGAPPRQPPYGDLVAAGLEQAHGSQVVLCNYATAGWTSDDGVAEVERVANARPDLVIVAFGMNDAGYAEAPDFAANIETIMDGVRVASPDVEFVLVSPMLPNPRWPYPVIERFPAYRDALAALCGAGAALADVTRMWTDLLVRKSVHDLTGNGINHPNDFGHRVYAQVILALLIDSPPAELVGCADQTAE